MSGAPAAPSGNREQLEFWNGVAADRWVRHQARLDRALGPFGEAALDRLGIVPGQSVLDVGCGTGETLLSIVRRLGGQGRVVGVDLSGPMLARARERTREGAGVELIQADASEYAFGQRFDALFSRFGVMFFADPALAFGALRQALRPSGRLGFVCWQRFEDNPWVQLPLQAARTVVADPPLVADPNAPGPFAFADPARVRDLLGSAGYSDIAIEAFRSRVLMSEEGLEGAVDFTFQTGPVARLLAEHPEPVRQLVRERIRQQLEPFAAGERVQLDGAAWLVSARA
ncbi:MAG TPA: methyltransferase domain-containing protein [Polyangiaceae bacterium]|nr:methyltransferase domain-containing protein [Polyangiaceae bacterium]